MKKQLLKLSLSIFTFFGLAVQSNAQCPKINCPSNITSCDPIVTYTMPFGSDSCNPILGADTFNYTGTQQIFVVPSGVNSVNIAAYGAEGGTNRTDSTNTSCRNGGQGGYATGTLNVIPGDTLFIYVGGRGYSGNDGGWNGGGLSCANKQTCAKGGGASDVRVGGITLNDRVIVAGGGGGAEYSACSGKGGDGGGLTGDAGAHPTTTTGDGQGGTQSAGGAGGVHTTYPGTAGTLGVGGAGGTHPNGHSGSGGGGYYGGGGSAVDRHAGGGSSYIGGVTGGSTTKGVKLDHGLIIISYNGAGPVNINQISGLTSGSMFPSGVTTNTFVATSGSFSDTCSFTVTVNAPDTSVSRNLSTFTANETGATYQWLNCDSNFMAISGATNQSYTATTNGSYAVVVSKNGCTDTSACQMIGNVGIANVGFGNISIYPNPTNGLFTIDMGSHSEAVNYTVTSIDGRIVTQKSNVTNNKIIIDLGNESKGVYLLKLHNHKSSSVFRITKL
jgi:hypothetical protein